MNLSYWNNKLKKSIETIAGSSVYVGILSDQNYVFNPLKAMQLGVAVFLGKPVRLVVKEGLELSDPLKKLAKKIVYYDDPQKIRAAVDECIRDLKNTKIQDIETQENICGGCMGHGSTGNPPV